MSTNDKVQEERRQVLRQDHSARTGSTLLDQTALTDPELGGRWMKQDHLKPQIVKGGPDYPKASGPWSGERAPEEPPLGFAIDDVVGQ